MHSKKCYFVTVLCVPSSNQAKLKVVLHLSRVDEIQSQARTGIDSYGISCFGVMRPKEEIIREPSFLFVFVPPPHLAPSV